MLVPHKCVSPNYFVERNLWTFKITWRYTDVYCPNYNLLYLELILSGKYTGVYRPNYFDKHHTGGEPPVGM